jgi:hypothetical protein
MEKGIKESLIEFLSAIFSGAIGGVLGTYIANYFNFHWLLLGLLVAALFLLSNKIFLLLFKKIFK